ncbi:glucose-6-phosphate isomerase [Pseudooceanicola sp. 216_PA32_1]|uniref:17 kDa surface antigen n=1 Tax=Pseudooceanicola pacificus TaxID=2676438 RepID=A0A844VZI0_9RHOB|nr:glycine zipper 2TM domain-containing protein [Pseudooceanicola pacificus]MWB77196.1 glucose-6-phosphate isomerase [Pseudooceanicola pacificus]
MTKWKIAVIVAVTSALSACAGGMSPEARTVAGVAGGAAAGLIAAEALNADNNWRIIAALGGAAAGTMVAQNTQSQSCAYANGNGGYYTAPCR